MPRTLPRHSLAEAVKETCYALLHSLHTPAPQRQRGGEGLSERELALLADLDGLERRMQALVDSGTWVLSSLPLSFLSLPPTLL